MLYYTRYTQALILSSVISSSMLHATGNNEFYNNTLSDPSLVAALSLGGERTFNTKDQTIYLTPYIRRAYQVSDETSTLAVGELFLGLQTDLYANYTRNYSSELILGRIGLALGSTNGKNINGTILDNADPQADNFLYSYRIRHSYFALKGQALYDSNSILIPWLSLTAGIALNNTSSYYSTPTIEEALPEDPFASKQMFSFTYAIGIGVQKNLGVHWQLGLGYELSDWGKSQLGTIPQQTQDEQLVQNHTFANSILFNITYLA